MMESALLLRPRRRTIDMFMRTRPHINGTPYAREFPYQLYGSCQWLSGMELGRQKSHQSGYMAIFLESEQVIRSTPIDQECVGFLLAGRLIFHSLLSVWKNRAMYRFPISVWCDLNATTGSCTGVYNEYIHFVNLYEELNAISNQQMFVSYERGGIFSPLRFQK